MTRNSIIIALLFFGFPIFLFLGSYYYEFKTQISNLSEELDQAIKTKSVIYHTLSNNKSLSIAGCIENRLGNSSFEMSDLEISEQNSDNVIARYSPDSVCRVELKDSKMKITEMMSLPAGKNWKWKNVCTLEKKVCVDNKNEICIKTKPLLSISNHLKKHISKLKDEIYKRKGKGFDDIKSSKRNNYIKTFIGKLLICSMGGDMESKKALQNFEVYFSTKLNVSCLEWYKNTLNTVNEACQV